ncbi:hypothetical protein ONS95_011454 [Cadophora gregata]|uniref:uncharacterized protein n=1 Tax=Cadophora gregata TaxID=51156 RepID=UPI0026DD1E3A|nr:uncharacterized protein ONS95_011454 [Cadophora gregata]KAK0120040.1 hypothetical protein ONS95_011454 [Cadophora gregata]KAK0121073.1 hypothetical protein ONS96_011256 [Cadophora gregata f. sp. sojae]
MPESLRWNRRHQKICQTPPNTTGLSSDFIGQLSEQKVGITDTPALPLVQGGLRPALFIMPAGVQDSDDVIGRWKVKPFKSRFKGMDASFRAAQRIEKNN